VPVELSQVMNEHLAGFSKAEWTQLKGFLRRMLENGEAMTGRSRHEPLLRRRREPHHAPSRARSPRWRSRSARRSCSARRLRQQRRHRAERTLVDPAKVGVSAAPAAPLAPDWWQGFGDPALTR
jgi:hypothetical protein